MISKDEFVKRVDILRQYNQDCRTLTEDLHKALLNGHSVVSFADKVFHTYVYDLAHWCGMDGDVLYDFIMDGKVRIGKIGEEMQDIIIASKLWDFYNDNGTEGKNEDM